MIKLTLLISLISTVAIAQAPYKPVASPFMVPGTTMPKDCKCDKTKPVNCGNLIVSCVKVTQKKSTKITTTPKAKPKPVVKQKPLKKK